MMKKDNKCDKTENPSDQTTSGRVKQSKTNVKFLIINVSFYSMSKFFNTFGFWLSSSITTRRM
jgi:hypothetical protein